MKSFLFTINIAFVEPSGHSQEQKDSFGQGLCEYICDYTNVKSKQMHHSQLIDEELKHKDAETDLGLYSKQMTNARSKTSEQVLL